ncbi:MAG: hypothetical protein AMXMBFR7_26800 [Planctomycetota bacterium]
MAAPFPTCVHEAGHLVACVALGGFVDSATVGAEGGRVTSQGLTSWRDVVAFAMAGEVAQAKLQTRALDWASAATKGDRALIGEAFAAGLGFTPDYLATHPAFLRELQRARLLIVERWAEVLQLAHRLQVCGSVSDSEARRVVKLAADVIEPPLPHSALCDSVSDLEVAAVMVQDWRRWATARHGYNRENWLRATAILEALEARREELVYAADAPARMERARRRKEAGLPVAGDVGVVQLADRDRLGAIKAYCDSFGITGEQGREE